MYLSTLSATSEDHDPGVSGGGAAPVSSRKPSHGPSMARMARSGSPRLLGTGSESMRLCWCSWQKSSWRLKLCSMSCSRAPRMCNARSTSTTKAGSVTRHHPLRLSVQRQ